MTPHSTLEKRLRIGLVVVFSLLVLTATTSLYLLASPELRETVTGERTLMLGEQLEIDLDSHSDAAATVVLTTKHDCPTYEHSRQPLADLFRSLGSYDVGSLLVMSETWSGHSEVAAELGLQSKQVRRVAPEVFAGFKIPIVPTLLVVDKSGRVLFLHSGLVTSEVIEEATSSIRSFRRTSIRSEPDPNPALAAGLRSPPR